MSNQQKARELNLANLHQAGFKPATWMPLPSNPGESASESGFAGGILRPEKEIADRLLCLCAVFAWGSAPPHFESSISQFIAGNNLLEYMTESEREIVDLNKTLASEQFANRVGWKLENMWPLAWTLGLADEPSATTGQISHEISGGLLSLFLPEFATTAESLLSKGQTQPIDKIIQVEDLFYLAHNAVRSGQLGEKGVVPKGFDPISDGGAIHERRHSLTWSLSPGTSWDETDLST